MIDSVDNHFGIRENCEHPIREINDDSGRHEHFTRANKTLGYQYTTKECRVENCNCEKPNAY